MKFKNISAAPGFYLKMRNGWKKLVVSCLQELDSLNIKIHLLQAKEKFGGLSIYYDLNGIDNKKVSLVVSKYIALAYKTCENCGSSDTVSTKTPANTKSVIYTRCEKCHTAIEKTIDETTKKLDNY